MARAASARIRPGIDLNRIIITLDRNLPPQIEMHGRVVTGNRLVDQATTVTVKTVMLDKEDAAWIERVKARFDGGS